MVPLIPKSVKMTAQMFARIHVIAEKMGYSDNQFIVEAMNAILSMIEQALLNYVPKVVVLARTASDYEKAPHKWACLPPPDSVDGSKRRKK